MSVNISEKNVESKYFKWRYSHYNVYFKNQEHTVIIYVIMWLAFITVIL